MKQRNCSGRDLNPHAFRHTPLKRTCLPFHHPSVEREQTFRRRQRLASVEYILPSRAQDRARKGNRNRDDILAGTVHVISVRFSVKVFQHEHEHPAFA